MTIESTWKKLASTVAYRGRTTLVVHTVLLADGTEAHYEVDESVPFAVATLIIDGDSVVLSRQYRYPIGRWIFDLPGGAGGRDELPMDAARRELEEELGVIPNDLRPLHMYFTNPGRSAWPVYIFVCSSGTTEGVAERADPAEQVSSARMTVKELDKLIANGEIVDASLLVARTAAAASGLLPPLAPAEPPLG
ncbi:MAG: NUDIX hydrolase [Lacisediminihabitans sp.]